VRLVESQQLADIHVRDPVAVSHHKCVAHDIFLHLLEAGALEGFFPRVGQGDFPAGLVMGIVNARFFRLSQFDRDVIVHQLIMTKIIFDHVAFISQSEDKLFEAELRIVFHDMPENGIRPDVDHRFGAKFRFFPKPRPRAAAEDNDFHVFSHLSSTSFPFILLS